jgi:hypothetical protein
VTADTGGLVIPMATYDAASNGGTVRAVRAIVPVWAAAATTATMGLGGTVDGTTLTGLYTTADPGADNSSTPPYLAKMWRPTNGWDQTKLDAAQLRISSDDATPDIGPHALGLEVLAQSGSTGQLFGDLASATQDPVTGGVLAVAATPTSGYDATLHYEEGGSPTDVATPGGTTTTEVIDAPDAPAVNYVALYPPAEDISDA